MEKTDKKALLEELKKTNLYLNSVISLLKDYQAQKQESLKTDDDIKEYRTLKEAIGMLEEIA